MQRSLLALVTTFEDIYDATGHCYPLNQIQYCSFIYMPRDVLHAVAKSPSSMQGKAILARVPTMVDITTMRLMELKKKSIALHSSRIISQYSLMLNGDRNIIVTNEEDISSYGVCVIDHINDDIYRPYFHIDILALPH